MDDSKMAQKRLELWHKAVFDKSGKALDEILSPNAVLHSPVVWKPKNSKNKTKFILENVIQVLEDFKYHRQFIDGRKWALEFSAHVGDMQVKGIDLIEFDENWQLCNIEVFVRPWKGLMALGEAMNKRIEAAGGEPVD